MGAYYNEIDPFAAAWLRVLIAQGHIPQGEVDERDIRDISPVELAGYTQCHFFAGIGGWAYAARLAGIPDDYPLWTGSCPCQPFSAAGGRAGFADERHLWPAFFHLIEQCEPELVLGEQVAGGNVGPWFDLVQADVEGMGYAFGLCPAPSAGFGAPHIRDRAFWVADAQGERSRPGLRDIRSSEHRIAFAGDRSAIHGLAHPLRRGAGHASGYRLGSQATADGLNGCVSGERLRPGLQGASGFVADTASGGQPIVGDALEPRSGGHADRGRIADRPGPVNGFWADADWLGCTDGKWRPVEPGTFPLAHGLPARVGRLRGYGNAINAEQAAWFIGAVIDHRHGPAVEIAA